MKTTTELRPLLKKRLQNCSSEGNRSFQLPDNKIKMIVDGLSDEDLDMYTSWFHSVKEFAEWITLLELNHPTDRPLPSMKELLSYKGAAEAYIGRSISVDYRTLAENIRFHSAGVFAKLFS